MLVEKIRLEKEERVLKIIRKHWFVLFSKTIGIIFVTLLPFPVLIIVGFFDFSSAGLGEINFTLSDYSAYIYFLSAFWVLMNWMTLFHVWTDFYLDVWVITSRRLVAIDQRGLFNRSIGSFRLERLQDLNIEINGFLATFFNFGIVEAQTAAGSEEEFRSTGIPDPRGVKSLIVATADALDNQHRARYAHGHDNEGL